MSLNTRIGDPFTLATLTKPVGSTNGRAHAAGVCGLSGIKKRKRTELAVGLDGEGVSIYSLQNPQLVTSYALPSSATFTTAPYSIYRKGSAKAPSHRYTYVSVTNSAQSDKLQLVCFHDRVIGDKTETSKTTYTPSSNARILVLDVLPVAPGGSSRDATHDLLAAFDNGDVVCLAADLDTVRWVANLRSLIPGADLNTQLYHFTTATARAVARGMLRGREDLSAILLPSTGEESTLPDLTQVLCVLSHHAGGATALTLMQIQPRSTDLNTPQLSPLKTLVSWHLPSPAANLITTSPPHYALHAATGVLHVVTSNTILSYSFSGITPKLSSEIRIPGLNVESFLRLSADTIMTFAQQTLRLLDVKFGSLQATHSIQESATSDPASPAKKRKNAHGEDKKPSSGNYHLVAYHADANLIIALQENEIIGMQYDSSTARKRRKLEGTSLLEALGKGIISQPVVAAQNLDNFEDRKKKFDRYAAKGKISKFEHAFAGDLCIELEPASSKIKQENEVNGGPLTNGVGPKIPDEDAMAVDEEIEGEENELSRWRMPKHVPDYRRPQYDQYALYALRKIFVQASAEETKKSGSGLKIQFFPPNVFQWLLLTGHLTKESIRRSIDQEKAEARTLSAITDKDIIKALVEFDPDLDIMSEILNGDQHLPLAAVVHVIRLLMQSLDDQLESTDTTEAPKLLTNGNPHHEEMDVDIDSELEAATHEIDHAMSILNQGLLIRSNTLRPALIRLHHFSPPSISSTLRSTLSRRDLETLIRLLHSEMKNGGWSMTYDFIDAPAEGTADAPDDNAVAIIASLLSCALDAIGAGAWVASVGNPSSTDASEIIELLYEDTSEALNGFWEARYMRGLLSEFLRFASNLPKSHKPSNEWLEAQGKPFAVAQDAGELPVLPLGAKPDMGIGNMKNKGGGRTEERSKREMGTLISRRVPKYSFERIVI